MCRALLLAPKSAYCVLQLSTRTSVAAEQDATAASTPARRRFVLVGTECVESVRAALQQAFTVVHASDIRVFCQELLALSHVGMIYSCHHYTCAARSMYSLENEKTW